MLVADVPLKHLVILTIRRWNKTKVNNKQKKSKIQIRFSKALRQWPDRSGKKTMGKSGL